MELEHAARHTFALPLGMDDDTGLSTTAATSLSPRSDDGCDVVSTSSGGGGPSEKERTMLVFDWDDCLFPTTILRRWHQERHLIDVPLTDLRNVPGVLTEAQIALWDAAEATAVAVVQEAQRLGQMLVITNSQQGWVKLSCQDAFPRLWPWLQSIPLYSARSQHETPEQSSALAMAWANKNVPFVLPVDWQTTWKQQAFRQHVDDSVCKVLAFGDSSHDRVAALSLRSVVPQISVSHVLTVTCPTMERYQAQWQVLRPQFEALLRSAEGVDMMVNMLPGK